MDDFSVWSFEYTEMLPNWRYLDDLFQGISRWSEIRENHFLPTPRSQLFLPKRPGESKEEYIFRFNITEFDDGFSEALIGYTDLMFENGIKLTAPDWFLEQWESISDTGLSGEAFLPQVALSVFRFGVAHIFVDWDEDKGYPTWQLIEPTYVVSWKVQDDNPSLLEYATLFMGKTEEGLLYRRYYSSGEWIEQLHFEVEIDGQRRIEYKVVDTGQLMVKSKPIPLIPLVPIHSSAYRPSLMIGYLTFRDLADKSRILYNVTSDYRRKMALVSTPVPVRYDPMGEQEDVILSPSRILDLRSPDARFGWTEPPTASLEISRQEKMDLEAKISLESSKFLQTPQSRQSAAASALSVEPLQSRLVGFVTQFLDGMADVLALHQAFMGVDSEIEMEIVPRIIAEKPKDSQAAFAVNSSYTSGVITRYSAVTLLNENEFVTDEVMEYELSQPETLPSPEGECDNG